MKLCVSTYSLSRWQRQDGKSLDDCLDWLAGIGIKFVEYAAITLPTDQDPVRWAKAQRKACDRRGLKIVSYCVGAELLKPADEQRQVIEQLKQQVDVAAALGAATMRHDVTGGPKRQKLRLSFAQVLERVVPAIREVADHAQSRGLKSSLENHGFYLQTAQRVGDLIKAVNHPAFGLTIDLGNFLCLNEDPLAATRKLAKHVVMAHAKDFHIRPKKDVPPAAPQVDGQPQLAAGWIITPTPIAIRGAITGHGDVNIPAQLKALKKAGYDGYLSLEFEGLEEPGRAVRLGLAYLEQQLAKL